jgi:hypothetical protein
MKPTSDQTLNAVLSAVPFPEALLTLESSFHNVTTQSAGVTTSRHPTTVDPSSAYGCVDWYLYPDSEVKSAAA